MSDDRTIDDDREVCDKSALMTDSGDEKSESIPQVIIVRAENLDRYSHIPDDVSRLLYECSSAGEYVRYQSPDEICSLLLLPGSLLIACYRCDDNSEALVSSHLKYSDLIGCLFATDRDFCQIGLESKEFLLSEMANAGYDIDGNTRIVWVSDVCTSPNSRKSGCASRLYEVLFEEIASDFQEVLDDGAKWDPRRTAVAQAVLAPNHKMIGFSQKRGFAPLPREYSVEDFGLPVNEEDIPWLILCRLLAPQNKNSESE